MGDWDPRQTPKLNTNNHELTSPVDVEYNCIAWGAGDSERWWWPHPDYFWPNGDVGATIEVFERMLRGLGYTRCADGSLIPGIEKWALYIKGHPKKDSVTHGARQLEDGRWASKMGGFQDIVHLRAQDVEGPCYGKVYAYYSRARRPAPPDKVPGWRPEDG